MDCKYDKLDQEIFDLESEIITIDQSLATYADNPKSKEWLIKAKSARRIKALQVEDLRRRRDLMQGFASLEATFVKVSRRLLDPETFQNLMEAAKEEFAT